MQTNSRVYTKAFTLVELLVVIGILGIILAITLIAIDPTRMFGIALTARRQSDISTIGKGLEQYIIDNRGLIPTHMYPLGTPYLLAKANADVCAYLVPQYTAGLPVDPLQTSAANIINCAASYDTGYYAVINNNQKVGVYAPSGSPNIPYYGNVPAVFLTPGGGGPTLTPTPGGGPISFASGVLIATVYGEGTPLFEDFDGDSVKDLLLINSDTQSKVLRNTSTVGSVSFATPVNIQSIYGYVSPSYHDVDGDGKKDLLVTSSGDNALYRNTSTSGTISFASPYYPSSRDSDSIPVWDDVDGDGKNDIVWGATGGTTYAFRNTSTSGTISLASGLWLGLYTNNRSTPIWTDVDGDGKKDLINPGTSGTSYVHRNTSTSGTISFGASPVNLPTADNAQESNPIWADVDGDGKNDVIIGGASNTSSVYRNTSTSGTISFAAPVTLAGNNSTQVIYDDIDGDGKNDVLVGGYNGTTYAYRNTSTPGSVSFGAGVNLPDAYMDGSSPLFSDIDGDGKKDAILVSYQGSYVYRNTSTSGTISFDTGILVDTLAENSYHSNALFEDVNNDTKKDLIIPGDYGSSQVYRNTSTSGSISFGAPVNLPFVDCYGSTPIFVDIDGDTKKDIVISGSTNTRVFLNTSY